MKFKIGDKVKLKDYSQFNDHREHKGEIGTVDRVEFNTIHIKWDDGVGSTVWFSKQKPYKVGGRSKNKCDIKFDEV